MIPHTHMVHDNSGDVIDFSTGSQYRLDKFVKPGVYLSMINAVINDEQFYIGERTTPVGSLRLQLEFHFSNQGSADPADYYDEHFINCILSIIHRGVTEIYVAPERRGDHFLMTTIVLESTEGRYVKQSMRFNLEFVMPAIRVDQATVNTVLKDYINTMFRNSNIQHFLDCQLERDLDSSWVKETDFQPFYGAVRRPDDAPMRSKGVYQNMADYDITHSPIVGEDYDNTVDAVVLQQPSWNIGVLMSDVLHGITVEQYVENVIDGEGVDNDQYNELVQTVYCALLTSRMYGGLLECTVQSRPQPSEFVEISYTDNEGLKNCETLIRLLPKSFYTSLPNIIAMAKALHSVDSGANGYQIFERNLKTMAPHINPGNDEQFAKMITQPNLIWSRCDLENTDKADTLLWFVKRYNPNAYERWLAQLLEPMMKECRAGVYTDKTIVTIIKNIFYDTLRVTYVEKRAKLYYYENHHWQDNCSEKYIYDVITEKLVNWLRRQRIELEMHTISPHNQHNHNQQQHNHQQYNHQLGAPPAPRGRGRGPQRVVDDTSTQIENLNQLIASLGSGKYFNLIKGMAMYELADVHFSRHVDCSKLVHAIKNGVIEIIGDRIYFREGRPNDYLAKSMGWAFRTDYSATHPDVIRAMKWMRSVYIEPEFYKQPQNQHWLRDEQTFLSLDNIPPLLDYVLRVKASCYRSGNREKRFYCQTGRRGDNGKSTVTYADGLIFGSHFSKVHMELLTKDWRSGANPEGMQMAASLMAVADEPNEGVMLNGNVIKLVSGNDLLSIRDMYTSGTGKVSNNTKVFVNCNVPPPIRGGGLAVKKRMVMTPHNALYSEECPYTNYIDQYMNGIFPMDRFFEENIVTYVNAIGWIYFQWYHRYATRPSEQPECVKNLTKKFWYDNDSYQMFVRQRMVGAAPQNGMLDTSRYTSCPDLYVKFKQWFMTMYPKLDIPTYTIFSEEMNVILGPAHEERWYGWTYSAPQANHGGMTFQL